jgi:hypothetical protein
VVKWAVIKKTPPEKIPSEKCSDSLTHPLFSYLTYQGKTDAELEKLYAEERKEEQRRKQASSETGKHNTLH